MNRTILYYPTIDIPSKSWLRHALLYWDEVSSIIPQRTDNKVLIDLSPDIQYLMDEGQFRPMKPEDLIFKPNNWEAFHNFDKELSEIVTSDYFQKFIQRQHGSSLPIHVNSFKNSALAKIHRNKVSDNILYFLTKEGLAKNDSNDHEWLRFEKFTGLLYMSLLAKYLADIDGNQTTIGTDYEEYEKLNFKRVNESGGFPVVNFNLNNILPTPVENVPFEKIIDFKRNRQQNLLHFKSYLSEFQSKISKVTSNMELKEISVTFKEGITKGVKDLNDVLSDSRIECGFKSFKSLINLKSPTLFASAGAYINNKLDLFQIPIDLTLIGIVTIGTIELTGNYIEQRNKERAKERDSSFSYIYHAQKEGIVNQY